MANTGFSVNHALARKAWSKELWYEALKDAYIGRFIGEGSDSLIQNHVDLKKGKGDRITVGLRMQLSGDGIQGDNTLEGNEEALQTYSQNVTIDQLRHAVRSQGKMSEQRVLFDLREECLMGLKDWWADRIDTWFFNQVCGNIVQSDTRYTGNQAIITLDANHIVRGRSLLLTANDSMLTANTATQQFGLQMIDYAVELAKTGVSGTSVPIRPLNVEGWPDPVYVAFLHPYQITDMRTSTDTNQWQDIQQAAMQGGNVTKNPIFTGALGMYNGTLLYESSRIPLGVSTAGAAVSGVRRGVLCGAQAAHIAFGADNSPDAFSWVEELFDYGNQLGVAAGSIAGLVASAYNSSRFGSIVMASAAAKHTG